jgi:hypothetical protein
MDEGTHGRRRPTTNDRGDGLMTTTEAMRARVRTRLEETTAAVWTDAEIDECVTGALETYSWVFPKETTANVAASEGATSVGVPSGAIDVRRVVLADGQVVPRRGRPQRRTDDEELAWETFAGSIRFSRALSAQTLTVWHTTMMTLADLPVSDEGLIVLGGVAQALDARGVQDLKRGNPTDRAVAEHARDDFERELARRARRVRAGLAASP